MIAAAGTVDLEVRDAVGWLEINNPARRNALSTNMMRDLGGLLRTLEDDSAVRVIVLRGRGTEAFAAGADISEFEAQQTQQSAKADHDEAVERLFTALNELTTPLIVMVHGHCLGAGMAVALAADLRFTSHTGRFAIPAARLGIGYPLTLTHALVDAVGPGHAAEMLYTACAFDADRAHAVGLVNAVVETDALEQHVSDVASQIARNAPLSVRAAKAAIKAHADTALVEMANTRIAACGGSDDAREGPRAFMERRIPTFEGH